jgi:DNA processing protein
MPLPHYLHLCLTPGLGPITIHRLIEALGSAQSAVAASASDLQSIDGIGPSKARKIHVALKETAPQIEPELQKAASLGLTLLCLDSPDYPPLLKLIPDPPPVLYVKGRLEPRDIHALAIVGSRKCSHYGREQADRFGALLAGAGVTVVSGGARGTDSAAHRGALSHPHGRTIAVLGSGLDVPYPPENKSLFDQIAERGAVISEYPLGTPPLAENFPRRNRIVSGLSRGVLVIEADVKSGALITARQAADDHNRPVLALPGRVDNPLSAGPHLLIRDGATLVTNLEEILESLHPLPHDLSQPSPELTPSPGTPGEGRGEGDFSSLNPESRTLNPSFTDHQSLILSHLTADPTPIDALIDRTALPAQVILQELTLLSLKGQVKRIDGHSYVRRR